MKKTMNVLLLTMMFFIPAGAQVQDDTQAADTAGIVAYSDTTDTSESDSSGASVSVTIPNSYDMDDDWNALSEEISRTMNNKTISLVLIIVVFSIFIFIPLLVLFLIIWLIIRNRNRRLKLAEKAVENGQPIPQEALSARAAGDNALRERGIKHIFLGLGLVACGYFVIGDVLQGCGILLFFFGLGQVFIARSSMNKNKKDEHSDTIYDVIEHEE